MELLEIEIKKMILKKFGNLKKFIETVKMPWTTLDSVLKRGINNSNITNVIKICEGLNIDCESLYHGEIKSRALVLSNDELNHVKKYQILDEYGKKIVNNTLDDEYSRCTQSGEVIYFHDYDSAYNYLLNSEFYLMGGIDFDKLDKKTVIKWANDFYGMVQDAKKYID